MTHCYGAVTYGEGPPPGSAPPPGSDPTPPGSDPPTPEPEQPAEICTCRVTGCALRNYGAAGGYWQPISDSGHLPINIASVSTSSTSITVHYTEPVAQVVTSAVTVDETLVALGYGCGASIGLGKLVITLARNGSAVDPRTVNAPSGNLWLFLLGT